MEEIFKPDFSNINIDYTLPTLSITQILGMLSEPFDQQGVAQKTFEKHFNNPKSQYYQKTVEQIIEMWSAKGAESCRYGSLLDDYIGLNLTKTPIDVKLFKLDNNYDNDERLHGLCDSFDHFYEMLSKSGDTVFIDRERTVYYQIEIPNPDDPTKKLKYLIKGRFDALFYNKRTKKWIIIDWKSSGTIDKVADRYTKNLLGPMCKFPALNYYTYTTQLYYYKKTLIANYLPEETKDEDVIVMIVNLPGKMIDEFNRDYGTHTAAYQYDADLLDKLYNFAAQKDYITKKIESEKIKQEDKEYTINKGNNEKEQNLEDLF